MKCIPLFGSLASIPKRAPALVRPSRSSLVTVNSEWRLELRRETAADSRFHLAVYSVVKGGRSRNRSTSWSVETPVACLENGSEWKGKTVVTAQKVFLSSRWVWKLTVPSLQFATKPSVWEICWLVMTLLKSSPFTGNNDVCAAFSQSAEEGRFLCAHL